MGIQMANKVICDFVSVFGFFSNFRKLKKADDILLFQMNKAFVDKIWIKCFKILNHLLLRKTYSIEMIKHYNFSLNPEVLKIVENNSTNFNNELLLRINKILKGSDSDVLKYIKRMYINVITKKLYIKKQAQPICSDNNILIITDKNHFGIFNGIGEVYEDNAIFKYKYMTIPINILINILVFIRILYQFKLRLNSYGKFHSDLLVQAQYFGYEGELKKEFLSEDYVFDKKKVALLITNNWRPKSIEETMKYKRRLKKRNINCIDVKDFSIDLWGMVSIIKSIISNLGFIRNNYESFIELHISFSFLYYFIVENLYLRNYKCRAMLCFDDYSPVHIIRTLLYRQHNIKTFGVQHSMGGGLYAGPSLAYICFDKYLIWGEYYKEIFAPFWNDLDLVKLSYNRIDNYLRKRRSIINENVGIVKHDNKKVILVLLPHVKCFHDKSFRNTEEMIKFLKKVDEDIYSKATIYVRLQKMEGLEEFRDKINNNNIKFQVSDSHTTTEWIDCSDLVVVAAGSGAMCECAFLGKKMILYDYHGCLRELWTDLGQDIYTDNHIDLYDKIDAYLNGKKLDINFDLLWGAMVYPNKGDSNQIICNLLDSLPVS